MIYTLKRAAIFFWLALLAGCSAAPVLPPAANPTAVWDAQQAHLSRIDAWNLVGRIGIHTEDESWQARIDWQQTGQDYTIYLVGPMGQGSLRLQGDERQVSLSDGEHTRTAQDAEALLYQEMGWRLPVKALRYWAIGLPAPGSSEQMLNPQGLLARLQQADWTIEFNAYSQRGAWLLPGRLFITNHRARIRLVVDNWTEN
jgi:outer membrane lipoprotein LolB